MPHTTTVWTYGECIKEICRMVGHSIPADPAGSQDLAVQQMGTAVNRAVTSLLSMFEWQDLTVKASLSVVGDAPGQTEKGFALPTDFHRFVDQTQWNQGSQLPAAGPVSPQAWMSYLVRNYAPQLTLSWQRRGDLLYFLAPPFPVAASFHYMYISKGTVKDADVLTDTKEVAAKNGDQFVIDDYLVMLLGRVKYLEWKGFDSESALKDFLDAYDSRVGANKGAPILNIGSRVGVPLIDAHVNVPDTGYGS